MRKRKTKKKKRRKRKTLTLFVGEADQWTGVGADKSTTKTMETGLLQTFGLSAQGGGREDWLVRLDFHFWVDHRL